MAGTTKKTVLVTGITGNQGGALARTLIDSDLVVRGMSRDPDSDDAKEMKRLGADVVRGDYDDPDSVATAAKGADVAFLVCTPYQEGGSKAETEQGIAAVDAVTEAGVGHILYSSVADADKDTGVPHFDSKSVVERHLRDGDVPWTIVAPVFFRENLTSPWWLPALKEGRLPMAMSGDRELQTISVPETGRFMAHVVKNHERFQGKRIDIASDSTTPETMADLIGAAADVDIEFVRVAQDEARQENEEFARMFDWFERVGYDADIDALRRDYPDVGWQGFAAWAGEQDWTEVTRAVERTA